MTEVGNKFGRLTIIRDVQNKKALCLCDCGVKKGVALWHLKSGNTTSCGCYNREQLKKSHTKHGGSSHPLYIVFRNIKSRCENPKRPDYKNYGGRGIKCEWKTLDEFIKDMYPSFKKGLQIDRTNNDGNYSKKNCRWVTAKVNASNRRRCVSFKGETSTDASIRLGGCSTMVTCRVRMGWDVKKAFTLKKIK